MAERLNGRSPYTRRTYGSERRGSTPVPAYSLVERQKQSQEDKARLQRLIREQSERLVETPERPSLGNRELPAFKHKAELVGTIESHKATVVGGETGSGKSTQLPQYLYEAGYDMTVMLVPRRVIADGLGDRVREELSSQIEGFNAEEEVGIIHGERVERHDNNKIVVMTPNTFIKMQTELSETHGDKKVAIVADEIHEANLYTEIAVGVAALSVQQNDNWRLVAASATHNADTLEAPFQKLNNGFVPKVEIEGRPFNVELREEPELTPMQAYARDGHEHTKAMIFTSGKEEISHIIEQTRNELESQQRGSSNDVVFRILHGELTEIELSHIDDPIPEGQRLVVVSSPAGMSGITIPGVTYVVTDGTINRSELDEDKADGLRRHTLSKAGVTQQIGRAGRDVPGGIGVLCAPVVVKKRGAARDENSSLAPNTFTPFNEREAHEPPEIYSTNLERIVLSVATLGYNFSELNEYIPHPVQQIDIVNAEEALARIGALDDENKVTSVGAKMNEYPIMPELARGLVEAGHSRTLQHMVRAAFIAAAIDVGGIQDYRASEDAQKTRRQIIRHTSEDDLIVQLDLMTKLYERTDENWDGHDFIERHGLHKKRVERVRKTTRKILNKMGIHPQNVIVTPPLPDEENLLRDDFTAGFIDQIYQDLGRGTRSKQRLYRNIHGSELSPERTIDNRSLSKIGRGALVAGMKRWFEKGQQKDGTPIKHDVIANVFPVKPEVVGRYAEQNGLVQGKSRSPMMSGDRAQDYMQGMFGTIEVGIPEEYEPTRTLSPEAQALLREYVLSRPGKVQQALRRLADELKGYSDRTPPEVLEQLRRTQAPSDLTQEAVTSMIERAVQEVTTGHEVEERLREYSYSSNISLAQYYDTESVRLMNEMSPLTLDIAGNQTRLRYEAGQPYVTGMTKRTLHRIASPVYLDDGREVLYQRTVDGKKEWVSFGVKG